MLLLSMLQRCSSQFDLHRLLQLLADVDKLLKSNGEFSCSFRFVSCCKTNALLDFFIFSVTYVCVCLCVCVHMFLCRARL